MISITKKIEFEAAHRLSNYDGSCREIHGHTYKLEVTVTGPIQDDTDMVLDFKILKKNLSETVLKHFDHSLILKDEPGNRQVFDAYTGKITWMNHEPTAERMLVWMASALSPLLPKSTSLESLRLYETSGSFASWKK